MRTAGGNSGGNAAGVCHSPLVHQIIGLALGAAQIGAQGIRCTILGVFDLAGHLTAAAIQIQSQLFKWRDRKILGFVLYKRKVTRIDHISPALRQPQEHHAVFLPVIRILDKVGACVDLIGGIDLTVLAYPVDVDLTAVLFHRQGTLDLLLAHAAVKGQ